jgi:Sporulation related domain.
MKSWMFLAVVFISFRVLGQDTSSVVVHKDPRIDLLIKKESDINLAIKRSNSRTARGYRVMILNTAKRDEAISAKTRIYTYFPELKAYLIYQSPYFKLKAGNFRTRDEAEKYQKELSVYFPKGVFVISDTIEVKPEKDND